MLSPHLDGVVLTLSNIDGSLTPDAIRSAIEVVPAFKPAWRRLHAYLVNNPTTLTSGDASVSLMLVKVLIALRNAGSTTVVVPRCSTCNETELNARSQPSNTGQRVCERCNKFRYLVEEDCAGCHEMRFGCRSIAGYRVCRACIDRGVQDAGPRLLALTASSPSHSVRNDEARVAVAALTAGNQFGVAFEIERGQTDLFVRPECASARFGKYYDALRDAGSLLPPILCGHCRRERPLPNILDGLRSCSSCYKNRHRRACDGCQKLANITVVTADSRSLCTTCRNNSPENVGECHNCGTTAQLWGYTSDGPLCRTCRRRALVGVCIECGKTAPCRFAGTDASICHTCAANRAECSSCGRTRVVQRRLPDGSALCGACIQRNPLPCFACGNTRQVRARQQGQPYCGQCASRDPVFASPCTLCDTVDNLTRSGLCKRCRATELINGLFDSVAPLSPEQSSIRTVLLSAKPQLVLNVFRRKTTINVVRSLLEQPSAISHETLSELGDEARVSAVRSFLMEHEILPARDLRLARFETWIEGTAPEITPTGHRHIVLQFARWKHLRRWRDQSAPTTQGQYAGARREILLVIEFLDWIKTTKVTTDQLTQRHVDRWIAAGHRTRSNIRYFMDWARKNHIVPASIRVASLPVAELTTTAEDPAHLEEVLARLLDESIEMDSRDRLSGALAVLFGIWPSVIVRLTVDDVAPSGSGYSVKLGNSPLQLPDALTPPFGRPSTPGRHRECSAKPSKHNGCFPDEDPGTRSRRTPSPSG